MEAALASACAHAEDAIHQGFNILIVSDRNVSAELMPIPALLATAAVHQHLVRKGLRTSAGLVVETGLGARSASFRAARRLRRGGDPSVPRARDARSTCTRSMPGIDPKESAKRFIKAICKGLYKVMSKMGISTYQSYCGAQIFEAVGLQQCVRRQVFHRHGEQHRGHRSVRGRRGGVPAAPARVRRRSAARATRSMPAANTQYRVRGEEHMWTPDSIAKLQHAARANSHRRPTSEYAALINDQASAS